MPWFGAGCCQDASRSCTIFGDEFGRADSTDLGSGWEELSGNWDIYSEMLREQSGSGVVRTTTEHPVRHPSGIVQVTLKNIADGDSVRLLVNCTAGGSANYVQCDVVASGPDLLVTVTAGGGNTSDQITYSAGNDVNLQLCYPGLDDPDGQITGEIMDFDWGESLTMSEGGVPRVTDGIYAGLQNVGGTEVEFDGFSWLEHWRTNRLCSCCCCSCDEKSLPDTLTLTVIGDGTDCTSHEITLNRNRDCVSEWSSGANEGPYGVQYSFVCSSPGCDYGCQFELRHDGGEEEACSLNTGWGWEWDGIEWTKTSTACACDPLAVAFDDDFHDDVENCPCLGTYSFDVTE
jgi:hypothetical protein